MLFKLFSLCFAEGLAALYTLLGECPNVTLQENFDPTRPVPYQKEGIEGNLCPTTFCLTFSQLYWGRLPVKPDLAGYQYFTWSDCLSDLHNSLTGVWYNVASYASDGPEIHDCSIIEILEDNLGYIYKETYVQDDQGNRTQKTYQARINPNYDPRKDAAYTLNAVTEHELEFLFFILATDYDNYAIAYTCSWLKEKIRTHYVFTWVLTRSKKKLQGELLKKVEDKLSKYTDLADHRQSFVFKDFSDTSCAYTNKNVTEYYNSNFF